MDVRETIRLHALAFVDRDVEVTADWNDQARCVSLRISSDTAVDTPITLGMIASLSREQAKQAYVALGDVLVALAQADADAALNAQVVPDQQPAEAAS